MLRHATRALDRRHWLPSPKAVSRVTISSATRTAPPKIALVSEDSTAPSDKESQDFEAEQSNCATRVPRPGPPSSHQHQHPVRSRDRPSASRQEQGLRTWHFKARRNRLVPRRGELTGVLETDQRWNLDEPTYLPEQNVSRSGDMPSWHSDVARARGTKLPLLFAQYLVRQDALSRPDGKEILELLPNDWQWKERLRKLDRSGISRESLESYAHIVGADNADESCWRLLESKAPLPAFLWNYVLRPSAKITRRETLRKMIEKCRVAWGEPPDQTGAELMDAPLKKTYVLQKTHRNFERTLWRLVAHCSRIEPRFLTLVVDVIAAFISSLKDSNHPDRVYMEQCHAFNSGLRILSIKYREVMPRTAKPNAYFWEAQRKLIAMSETLERPLRVSREGFRAIRTVLSGLPKSHTEKHSSKIQSKTWPPYMRPADGMDELAGPGEIWSRVVQAGVMMQEAGFPLDESDEALNILQGRAPDGTPTIQQRVSPSKNKKPTVWAASISATRNAQEAWARFQRPPTEGQKPKLDEYAAMFEKLFLRESPKGTDILPGDKAFNFPDFAEVNLTEFEKARAQPPSVDELYRQMRLSGVRPEGRLLRNLINHADSLHTVYRYLIASTLNLSLVNNLISANPDPELLKEIPPGLFSDYVLACCNVHGARAANQQLKRVLNMVASRFAGGNSDWAPFTWGIVLKSLSRPHDALFLEPEGQLRLMREVVGRIERHLGASLSIAVQYGRGLRKVTSRQVRHLTVHVESGDDMEHHALRGLYNLTPYPTVEDTAGAGDALDETTSTTRTTAEAALSKGVIPPKRQDEQDLLLRLLREGASKLNKMLSRLYALEDRVESTLGDEEVSPLDRLSSRQDPILAEQAREVMLALGFLGDFDGMTLLMERIATLWSQEEVTDALAVMDDVPAYADFSDTLCVFRALAEPMMGRGEERLSRLREKVVNADNLALVWPDDATVERYCQNMAPDGFQDLRRVLEWTRTRKRRRAPAEDEEADDTRV